MKPLKSYVNVRASRILLKVLFLASLTLCLLPVSQAHADALSDLRATLQNLNANTEIKGTLDVQSIKVNPKKDDDQNKGSKPKPPAQLQLEIDAGAGLGLHLSPALLQQIDTELQAHTRDPEQPTPTSDLLGQVGPMDIERIVSAAPGLLRALDGAESVTSKQTQLDGLPVQELSMKVPFKASKKERSDISDYQGSLTLWLDAKGIPLAYQRTFHGKFCKFFLCMTIEETWSGKLQDVAGRLVAVSYSDETRQSGLGQDGDTRNVYTLNLGSAPADKVIK